MECPKCGCQQPESVECKACGVIVARYREQRIKRQYDELYGEVTEDPKSRFSFKPLATPMVVAGALAIVAYFLVSGSEPELNTDPVARVKAVESAVAIVETDDPNFNAIEYARDATLLIKTRTGTGTGFFVNDKCQIVTNLHVVDPSDENLDRKEEHLGEQWEQVRAFETEVETRKAEFLATCQDCSEAAYEHAVGQYERRLVSTYNKLSERQEEFDELSFDPEILVVTSNGGQYDGTVLQTSGESDLALLRIDEQDCSYLDPADTEELSHGAPLYTIGSPLGMGHSVSAGVFSGFPLVR